MLIDWFTVGAQVVNFIILVWLMKRFLFKPILAAVEAREKHIASELKDAKAKQTEAKQERDEFQQKNEEFDNQRADLLAKATAEAATEHDRLMLEARKSADEQSTKRQELLAKEAHNLNERLGKKAKEEVFAITRKLLLDLADTQLEERMCDVFVRRLSEMDAKAKSQLSESLNSTDNQGSVRSTFGLSKEQRETIQEALNATLDATIPLTFESKPDLISGIELTMNGQKLSWSIDNYLTSLVQNVTDAAVNQVAPKIHHQAEPVKVS